MFQCKYSAMYSQSIFCYSWPMFPRWQVDTCKCISCQPLWKTNNLYTCSVYMFFTKGLIQQCAQRYSVHV